LHSSGRRFSEYPESNCQLKHVPKLHGVIFDLDGTLADTLPLVIAAFRTAIEPLANRSLTDAEIIATFGPSEEGTIRALIPEHYEQGVANYLTQYEALHDGWPDPFPGIPALLTDLKARGVRLALVTGKGEISALMSLKRYGMDFAFENIETGDPNGPRKAECIQKILTRWQIAPAEAVYVGDAPTDVTAAREAGVGMIGAGWAPTTDLDLLAAQHPDVLLKTVDELKEWLDARIA
jgi:phosphoglycolate phosphatase-like HAD superfamily hydrolase